MPSLIGQSLGRYHILEQLGEGGMATVYKAYDTRLERDVAIKAIRREAFPAEHHARIFKRFEREAMALSKLSHPHIVSVIEYGEHDESPFLVMECLPGGTLKQKLGNPMPWVEAIRLILPIAQALGYAHKQGIIHRDVKPSNILITASGEPMLADFGIAKLLEADEGQTLSTTTGVGVGTPEYMSPEQGLGKKVDARADIYSLGVVLYELIAGRKPFRADTPMAVIVKHVNDPLPRPRQFVREIPDTVEKALFKALAKKPEDRYGSMAEFAETLDVLLEQIRLREKAIVKKKEEIARKEAETARKEKAKKKAREARVQRRQEKEKERKTNWIPWSLGVAVALLAIAGIVFMVQKQATLATPAVSPFSTNTADLSIVPAATSTHLSTPTPTPLPAPPYKEGTVLFETDFEFSKISDFDFSVWSKIANDDLRNPSQYWSIGQDQNGNHYLIGDASENKEISFQLGKPTWGNYMIEARFNAQRLPSNGQGGAAISLRGGSSGLNNCPNGYEFAFGEWLSIYNDCVGHLVTAPHGKVKEDKWYYFRIESYNDEFREYVDGELIHRLFDDTSSNGYMTIGTGLGGKVYYDNIRVVELVERVPFAESTPLPDEITDEKGVVMRFVPAGDFSMGSNQGESNEQPVHIIYLDAYYMDKYEVTNARYKACVNDGNCTPPRIHDYYDESQYNDYPVFFVDWEQANSFCGWRGSELPTEAQWEKAARGTDGRTYPWGEGIDCGRANYYSDSSDCKTTITTVGSYENGISPYGIYDLIGNVSEWIRDWYDPDYYNNSPLSNPIGPSLGDYRVLRGGSWASGESRVYASIRNYGYVGERSVGFRCVRSITP